MLAFAPRIAPPPPHPPAAAATSRAHPPLTERPHSLPRALSGRQVQIVERFGKFDRVANPGLNWVCPVPCFYGVAGTISMRLQQMEVACETKSKDNVFVVIKVAIQYQVVSDEKSIVDAHYRLTNPRQQIESYVYDVVRSTVPKIELDDVFTTKEEIAGSIAASLKEAMSSFGYQILGTPITDIEPDREVCCPPAARHSPLAEPRTPPRR